MADTIFAPATPPGISGVAVVRVSGPGARQCAGLFGAHALPLRSAVLRKLMDPQSGAVLDHALLLRFDGPASFTGEDIVEFHVHGGPAVVRGVTKALASVDGVRLAEPGEFTRRALMNGKVDLAQVEGIGDLLVAETAMQAQQAVALMEGRVSRLAGAWRNALVSALASLEASIDFSDDGVPDDVIDTVASQLADTERSLMCELAASRVAEQIRLGFEVALVGAPNVGKSMLLNAMARRDVAITSEFAGTTRDVLEVRLDLQGVPVTVLDTAGMRAADDPVESIGIERARARANQADVRVFLVDADTDAATLGVPVHAEDIVVLSKADRRSSGLTNAVSGLTGQGLAALLDRIHQVIGARTSSAGGLSHERHRDAVVRALSAVRRASPHLVAIPPRVEVASAEIRVALDAFDFLVGRVDVEHVLDVVFARFCLGK